MDIKAIKDEMNELRKKLKESAGAFLKDNAKVLFDKYPQLKSFSWRQYTPYFNDGDVCEFSAHTSYPSINGGDDEEEEEAHDKLIYLCTTCAREYSKGTKFCSEDGGKIESKTIRVGVENLAEIRDEVEKFLSVFEDEDLLMLYGDHAEVTVTRKGVEVSEYQHD